MSEFLQATQLWAPGATAMLCLILASGFFSGSETALFFLSHDELRAFRSGRPREQMAAALLSDPDRLLTAVLFWNLVVNLCYFAVSVVVAQRLMDAGQTAAAGIFGLGGLFAIILLGEVLPKSMAVVFRKPLAAWVSWPLAFAVRAVDGIIPLLRTLTLVARRTFWPHVVAEPYLEADDLERAVEVSELSDDVIRQERQVLHNILDLSEILVEEVMRPRGTYISRKAPVSRAGLEGIVPPGDYLMVQEPDTEHIASAVPLADLAVVPDDHLEAVAEPVVHVPWCSNLADTLALLREQFASVSAVVNEFGETIGVITLEDIVDTILVPEPSRAKRVLRREPVLEVAPGRFHVEGITTLRYLAKRLQLEYEHDEESMVTVAGMLHDRLEHLPVVGDECEWRGYLFKVFDVSKRGQIRVMVSRAHEPSLSTNY